MAHATQSQPRSTDRKLSGYCRGDGTVWGHEYCDPGPLMVGTTEVLPRTCFCSCHSQAARR